MILPIDDRYQLAADMHSWAIQRRTTRKHRKTGEQVTEWESIKWYTTLEGAGNGLAELMLRTADTRTLSEAMAEVKRITAELSRALRPHVPAIREPVRKVCNG